MIKEQFANEIGRQLGLNGFELQVGISDQIIELYDFCADDTLSKRHLSNLKVERAVATAKLYTRLKTDLN